MSWKVFRRTPPLLADGTQMSLLSVPEETSPAVEARYPTRITDSRQALEWIWSLEESGVITIPDSLLSGILTTTDESNKIPHNRKAILQGKTMPSTRYQKSMPITIAIYGSLVIFMVNISYNPVYINRC